MISTEIAALLKLVADRSNGKIRTVLPGVVSSFDAATQRATVVPALYSYRFDVDLDEPVAEPPPAVTNAPVWYPAGGGYSIRFPLQAGDDCLLLVAERSIDEWAGTGNPDNIPRDLRRFDLSDAIVLPGIRPAARPLSGFDEDNLEVKHDNGSVVRLNSSGKVYLGNASADLTAESGKLTGEVQTILTALLALATSLSTATTFPNINAAGSALITALTVTDTTAIDLAAIKVAIASITE